MKMKIIKDFGRVYKWQYDSWSVFIPTKIIKVDAKTYLLLGFCEANDICGYSGDMAIVVVLLEPAAADEALKITDHRNWELSVPLPKETNRDTFSSVLSTIAHHEEEIK
jgi:hypothetical protein